jgi:hypothetical protein
MKEPGKIVITGYSIIKYDKIVPPIIAVVAYRHAVSMGTKCTES